MKISTINNIAECVRLMRLDLSDYSDVTARTGTNFELTFYPTNWKVGGPKIYRTFRMEPRGWREI